MSDDEIRTRLSRIESMLESLVGERSDTREFYSTSEVAKLLDRAEFTVREWCRLGRILAEKRACGRGCSKEWMISQDEVERIKNEGLLPL
jgi:transposase